MQLHSPSFLVSSAGLVILAMTAARADAQFAPSVNTPVGTQPNTVAAGDWDGDGDLDLALPATGNDTVVLLFNNGTGAFGNAVTVPLGGGTSPWAIAAANLDGDGDTDLAVTLEAAGAVRVLLNNGTGTFSPGSLTAVGPSPRSIGTADLSGDAPDLVVGNRDGGSLTVLLNNGDATFTTSTVSTGGQPRAISFGDLNGDGDLDIAASIDTAGGGNVALLANSGEGGFDPAGNLVIGAGFSPQALACAPITADGALDIVVATFGNGFNEVALFTNAGPGAGAGAFTGPGLIPVTGLLPEGLVALDADVDGDIDVATANHDSDNVSVLANDGTGTFAPSLQFAVGDGPQALVAFDFDGNGGTDLAVADTLGNTASVLLNVNSNNVFTDLGGGLAGAGGIPALEATGSLQQGSPVDVSLSGAAINANSLLVVGLNQVNLPFKGGTLVPDADALIFFTTNGLGSFSAAGTWPAGLPTGTDIYLQIIVTDAGALKGFALSNTMHGKSP